MSSGEVKRAKLSRGAENRDWSSEPNTGRRPHPRRLPSQLAKWKAEAEEREKQNSKKSKDLMVGTGRFPPQRRRPVAGDPVNCRRARLRRAPLAGQIRAP